MSGGVREWSVVRVELPAAAADEIAGRLGSDALGVELRETGPERTAILVYVETREQAESIAARCRTILGELPGESGLPGRVSVAAVGDGRWVERYQASLGPLAVGERFVVVRGEASIPGGRVPILMVPGRAFGTGEHATTRLCASALETLVRPGAAWLDVGTGTGLLALVAARCGARRVLAVDIDPEAVAVARHWVELNGMSDRIEVRLGGIERCRDLGFDGAVANVSTTFLEQQGSDLIRTLRRRGVLVASGFPVEDAAIVRRALTAAGFVERRGRAESGWGVMVLHAGAEEGA